MDGVVIWIYAIFLVIVCENKNVKEVNLSDKFQRHIVNNYKQLSLYFLSRVEALKWNHLSLLLNAFSNYSCTT